MSILEQTEKIEYLDYYIKLKATGNAENLSKKLNISVQTIYRLIGIMRELGCPISYCKTQQTYYYEKKGSICLKFQEEKLNNTQLEKIIGGKRITTKKLLTLSNSGSHNCYVCNI